METVHHIGEPSKAMDKDKMNHSIAVANKMVEIAKAYGFPLKEQYECYYIGLNHDIGYMLCGDDTRNHNKIGGEFLRDKGFKYWREVYFHGELNPFYDSEYLDILNKADMQIDKYGNDVGYEKRLEDIASRYGEDSEVTRNCRLLVEQLLQKNKAFHLKK